MDTSHFKTDRFSMPSVAVVIPTYNRSSYILETLRSVFAQTFTDYEVIVINDGSPDDTAKLLEPFVKTRRIRYFEQKMLGKHQRGIREWRVIRHSLQPVEHSISHWLRTQKVAHTRRQ